MGNIAKARQGYKPPTGTVQIVVDVELARERATLLQTQAAAEQSLADEIGIAAAAADGRRRLRSSRSSATRWTRCRTVMPSSSTSSPSGSASTCTSCRWRSSRHRVERPRRQVPAAPRRSVRPRPRLQPPRRRARGRQDEHRRARREGRRRRGGPARRGGLGDDPRGRVRVGHREHREPADQPQRPAGVEPSGATEKRLTEDPALRRWSRCRETRAVPSGSCRGGSRPGAPCTNTTRRGGSRRRSRPSSPSSVRPTSTG